MALFEKKYVYKPSGMLCEDDEIVKIGQKLSALGYLESKHISRYYTIHYHYAVRKFQRANKMPASGICDNNIKGTLNAQYDRYLKEQKDQADSTVSSGGHSNSNEVHPAEDNQYLEESFFSAKRDDTFRRNNYNIVIQIGDDDQHVKAITGVRLRSKTIQLDASGQPISESFEFIAKDLKENTEPTDQLI